MHIMRGFGEVLSKVVGEGGRFAYHLIVFFGMRWVGGADAFLMVDLTSRSLYFLWKL